MKTPKIKICGITRVEDVRAAVECGAHAIGLNFVKSSPRYVDLKTAAELIRSASAPDIKWCGVFVNATADEIARAVEALALSVVQLHGDEDGAFVSKTKAAFAPRVAVWKALRVAASSDLDAMQKIDPDGWLIDSKVSGVRGGSGKTFDWSLLSNVSRTKPLILSGGLNPTNVADAVRQVAPDWVDVASGVESSPGIKDRLLIEQFVKAIH